MSLTFFKRQNICLVEKDMSNKIEDLNIDFSFKKNNVDELFFNLSENPEHFKNKDFRYTLSMIYQIIEDESILHACSVLRGFRTGMSGTACRAAGKPS